MLVERIFTLLTDRQHPLNMDNLLVVTFTNAAAAEMKERVEDRLLKSLEEDRKTTMWPGSWRLWAVRRS